MIYSFRFPDTIYLPLILTSSLTEIPWDPEEESTLKTFKILWHVLLFLHLTCNGALKNFVLKTY